MALFRTDIQCRILMRIQIVGVPSYLGLRVELTALVARCLVRCHHCGRVGQAGFILNGPCDLTMSLVQVDGHQNRRRCQLGRSEI